MNLKIFWSNGIKKKWQKTLLITILIATILTILMPLGFLNTWESKISDAFYTPSTPLSDIIIVEIDDESIYKIGEWPFSRDHYAQVIQNLNKSKIIGIDILFDLPRDGDDILANVLKNHSVVLAIEYQNLYTKNGKIYADNNLKPNPSLGDINKDFKVGFINLFTDNDKVTRSFTPIVFSNEMYELFSAVIINEIIGYPPEMKNERMLINFYSKPRGFEYVSFYDVYNNSNNLPSFESKIVLIGFTASGVDDTFMVPISEKAMAGVEIHANIIQSILTQDFIYYQDDISSIVIVFFFALLTALFLLKFKIKKATIFISVSYIIFFLVSLLIIYDQFGIIMNILYPLFSTALIYTGLVALYYSTEEKSRKWITSLFGKYVSPIVIDNLLKNPDNINLGGERRNITILFSDIRGFTSISENISPEGLVHLLNEYLTEMTTIITSDQGLVDKYMGDAIMAFWGAPLTQPNHAELCCFSSIKMIEKLKELQKQWKKEGIPSFDIGIGINTGDAIVGNMGSEKRFDYTAMGDNVNLASRMEGLNKMYGTSIIITENTYKIVKDKFDVRKLDAVRVKGKRKPILIYELLATKGNLNNKQSDLIVLYEQGLDLYFQRKWKKAIKSFEETYKINKDKASAVLIKRCKDFIENPPPSHWNGVWDMKIK